MSLIFDNFEILPIGNANLAIVNNKLEVTNLGNSGLDGFQIVSTNSATHIKFDNINFGVNGCIRNNIIIKRGTDVYTSIQSSTYKDSLANKINFSYDFSYVSHVFEIFGKKNGVEVFSIQVYNPVVGNSTLPNNAGGATPQIIDWVAVAAVATVVIAVTAVYEALKPSKVYKLISVDYWPNGNVRRENYGYIEDPTPIDIEVNGQIYNVDEWGIRFEKNYDEDDNIQDFEFVSNQITCSGISSITIESIIPE